MASLALVAVSYGAVAVLAQLLCRPAPCSMRLPVRGLLESAIYGADLEALERFYVDIFRLELIARADHRLVALRCGHGVLLLFDPSVSRVPGPIPEHGTTGAGHIAFVIEDHERAGWKERLEAFDVAIEREVEWQDGGTSIYFRDPAGNSVELAPPGIWGGIGRALLDATHGNATHAEPGDSGPAGTGGI